MIVVAGAMAATGGLLAQVAAPTSLATLPVSDIRPGMHGYGLTVFRGMRPERFDVEVIDVLHDFRPRQDLVLVRPSHPILDHALTVQGMSGSPIYVHDRLVGAYAYAWEFGRDTVAGVTPIASMLAELHRPRRAPSGLLPGGHPAAIPLAEAPSMDPMGPWPSFARHAMALREPVATAYGNVVPMATPITMAGASPAAVRHLAAALEPLGWLPVQAGGSNGGAPPADAPTHYENGGAFTVQLLSGDVNANATGTVTAVMPDGDLVAFGHPMASIGETALPTAIARVLWILASERSSFKIAEPVRSLGALIQDRPSCVVVSEHAVAPTVPVRVHIHGVDGAPHPDWHAVAANQRSLVGHLVSTVIETALDDTAGDRTDLAWTIRSRISLRDRPVAEFTEYGTDSEGVRGVGTLDATDFIDRLQDNPFGVVTINAVDIDVELHWARDFAYVRSVALAREEADPGQSVDVVVTLGRYGHVPEVRTVRLAIPRSAAGHDVDIEVSAGGETLPDLAAPESLDDLVHNLTTRFPDDAVVVSMRLPGQGVALRGRVVGNLPGSAFDTLRPSVSTDTGEPIYNLQRTVVPIGRIVTGRDHVRLHVRELRL